MGLKDKIMGTSTDTPEEPAVEEVAAEAPAPVFLDKGAEEARAAAAQPPVVEAPDAEAVAAFETPTRTTFQAWVEKCIHDSPLSRHTESYNYLLSQLPELEAMLKEDNKA